MKHWAQLTADTLFAALLISRQADPYWLTPAANASTAEDDPDARGLFDIGRYGCYARGVGQCADALAVVVLVWAFFALMAIIKKLGTSRDSNLAPRRVAHASSSTMGPVSRTGRLHTHQPHSSHLTRVAAP